MAGLQSAAQQLSAYGRGPDTMLAHISPDEAQFIDQIQGGRKTNPMTGLPEYSLFGKILKAVVRVGAGIGGFMLGGPAGAAAGSAAATKLTGGSWKDALKAGAFSGIGSGVAQGLGGGGWSLTGNSTSLGNVAGLAGENTAAMNAGMGLAGETAAAAAPAAGGLGQLGSQLLSTAQTYPGMAAGIGALSTPLEGTGGGDAVTPPPPGNTINVNAKPFHRQYQPYTGDYNTFGQQPGGWKFFDEPNPMPEYAEGGRVRGYAFGGGVDNQRQLGQGLGGFAGLRNPGIPSQITVPHLMQPGAPPEGINPRDNSPQAQRLRIRQAAMMGYVNAKDGGAISGPGDGESDSIPAMLSDGEHVVDQKTVSMIGGGSNAQGHKALERMKQRARAGAGMKHPKKPPAFGGA